MANSVRKAVKLEEDPRAVRTWLWTRVRNVKIERHVLRNKYAYQ